MILAGKQTGCRYVKMARNTEVDPVIFNSFFLHMKTVENVIKRAETKTEIYI